MIHCMVFILKTNEKDKINMFKDGESIMYCSKCGKEIPDTAKFCTVCGVPVKEAERASISSIAETADKGNRKKRFIGIGMICTLVIVIAGGFVLHANRKAARTEIPSSAINETQPSEAENTSEPETEINTGFVTQNGELYYYDTDGELIKGWIEENGSRYYAAYNGILYTNGIFEIEGMQYIFDESGICTGDQKMIAEEDAKLQQTLNAQSNLTELMTVLVHYYIGGGFHDNASATFEAVQASINCLLNGEQEGIEELFKGETAMAQCLGYVKENAPSNIQELYQQYGRECYLTKEQIQYLVYSICGKQVEMDLSHDPGWHKPYLGFGGAAGDITWNELRNFNVERVDADTWQVKADVYYGCDGWYFYVNQYLDLVGKVCFTVIKNADSCFDSYSIANAEVELTGKDAVWKDAYVEYICYLDSQIKNQIDETVTYDGMDAQIKADLKASISYDLIDINNDDIPELYAEYPIDMSFREARIVTYYNGQLIDSKDEYEWSFCEYIEKSGLCYGVFDRLDYYEYGVYKLENGKWKVIGSGGVTGVDVEPNFEWNGTTVSSYEEIERNINTVYDTAHSSVCGKSISAFDLIKLLYPDAELAFASETYSTENDSISETMSNGIVSNGICYFTNNDEFEAALTQEQYEQWGEIVGPNLYSRYGGQLYFEGFDGVVLRASCATADITVTCSNNYWTGLVIANK